MPTALPSRRPWAIGYLWLQAAAVVGFWLVLALWPASRSWFLPTGWPPAALFAFALGDGLLVVLGGITAAVRLHRDPTTAHRLLLIGYGAIAAPTLWCISIWLTTGEAGLGALLMLAGTLGQGLALRWAR